jgi:hypothetical protein
VSKVPDPEVSSQCIHTPSQMSEIFGAMANGFDDICTRGKTAIPILAISILELSWECTLELDELVQLPQNRLFNDPITLSIVHVMMSLKEPPRVHYHSILLFFATNMFDQILHSFVLDVGEYIACIQKQKDSTGVAQQEEQLNKMSEVSVPKGILICNDDGPPSKHSPFQYIFITKLLQFYGYTADNAHDASNKPKVFV